MPFKKFKKSNTKNTFVEPDEIFLDSKNLENFDRQQFEGRIEKPIKRITIKLLGAFFLLAIIIFGARLVNLQIQKGDAYRERSENNTLEKINIFTERGVIYDRNKKDSLFTASGRHPFFVHYGCRISCKAGDGTLHLFCSSCLVYNLLRHGYCSHPAFLD